LACLSDADPRRNDGDEMTGDRKVAVKIRLKSLSRYDSVLKEMKMNAVVIEKPSSFPIRSCLSYPGEERLLDEGLLRLGLIAIFSTVNSKVLFIPLFGSNFPASSERWAQR
jgi:hypothetical protein